jgi:hypothetical protein
MSGKSILRFCLRTYKAQRKLLFKKIEWLPRATTIVYLVVRAVQLNGLSSVSTYAIRGVGNAREHKP